MTITFNTEQWERLMSGVKHATVRRGAIPVKPGHNVVYSTSRRHTALVWVNEVIYKRFSALTLEDALAEGYGNQFELKQVLEGLYPDIQAHETVTVVRFGSIVWHD